MAFSHWPLADLRLQTPELVLRWPSPADLHALADLAAAGVHDPEVHPFMIAWTDASPGERARSTLQYHWSRWGSWKPSDWTLELAVIRDGVVVLGPRELFVVPRGVEHCPRADAETAVLLFEPSTVINAGDAGGELTAEVEELA